jgi:hypothetical protein
MHIAANWRITAIIAILFALEAQLTIFAPQVYRPMLKGRIASSSLATVDELDLSLQESAGAPKIMNHESMSVRMRAFRVINYRGGIYSKWIVIEDVERGQFRTGASSSGSYPSKGMKAEMDKNDAWNVLNSLKNATRTQIHWPVANSIDAAISQEEIRMQEFWDRARHSTVPSASPKESQPTDQISRPTIAAAPSGYPSDDELERMIKEVWDFAGGKRLKWKPISRTPSGRKCDVLTFDGSDVVLVSPTSIKIPT